ncbi:MAG: short-chain fatty acid transporter [Candidatus Zixiibacteriota bacterium]
MRLIERVASALTAWSVRWVPNSFIIAGLLTLIVVALALTLTGAGPLDCVIYWGDGFWELLSFGMQMCLIIFTGYIVAVSPPLRRVLSSLARIPRGPKSAIFTMTMISLLLSWFHWGLSMVGSALMVRFIAAQRRDVDYRLLVACAYLGMGCTWHAGLSASAPLLVATPGHFLEAQIGIIPMGETIFAPFNLILVAFVFVFLGVFTPMLHPRPERTVTVDPSILEGFEDFHPPKRPVNPSPSERFEHSYLMNAVLGLMGMIWVVWYFVINGGGLTLNAFNFTVLFLGILLHRTTASFLKAAGEGGNLIYGIVLQFPFYAGMYGIIKSSGLTEVLSEALVTLANRDTYPAIVYWYSGIVNYFVPSGGSKWAIEAPYVLEAAKTLGVAPSKTVVAYAWGDMATDIIQPFWAIPLLAVAKLDFKDIMGYGIMIFTAYALLVTVAFLLFP